MSTQNATLGRSTCAFVFAKAMVNRKSIRSETKNMRRQSPHIVRSVVDGRFSVFVVLFVVVLFVVALVVNVSDVDFDAIFLAHRSFYGF